MKKFWVEETLKIVYKFITFMLTKDVWGNSISDNTTHIHTHTHTYEKKEHHNKKKKVKKGKKIWRKTSEQI